MNHPPIRSDGFGYYVYLSAVFIDHDLDLERYQGNQRLPGEPHFRAWTNTGSSGRPVIKYTLGVAILAAPFFLVAHLLALLGFAPADGFSWPYQWAMNLSGLAYGVLGLVFLRAWLKRHFAPAPVTWTILAVGLGTNLIHYFLYDASFSHAYSFAAITLFMAEIERCEGRPQTWRRALWLGVLMGVIFVVRVPNALWWAALPLYGIVGWRSFRENFLWWISRGRVLGAVFGGAFAVMLFQLLYWRATSGSWFLYSYTGERFLWGDPQFTNVLFSVRKGLFFWTPLMFAAVPGLFLIHRSGLRFGFAWALLLPLNLYVVSSWSAWYYGGSFGHRAMVDSYGVMAVGLAAFLRFLEGRKWACPVRAFVVLASCWSIWMMVKYWYHSVPYDGATWEALSRTFFQIRG